MGSNTLFRKISSIAVAILLLIYVGYQIYRSQYTGFKTETAMYADLSASIDTTGFIIRNEELVYSRYDGVLNYTLDDGEKTAFGGTVAELYPAEEDAAAHNRMLRIDEELTRLAVLENPTEVASSNPKNIGSQINKTVTGLLSDLKSGAFSSISNDKNDLYLLMGQKQIVTGAEDSASYVAHIENLKSERATLETTTSSSTGTVTSPASGYFIHTVDGYENAVDTDDVEQLTVSDVRALEEGEAGSNADSTVIGKVAKEFNWYIACIIDENDLVRLDRTTNVKVEMPFATAETIPAEVVKINRDEASGDAVVILKCSYMNTDIAARAQRAAAHRFTVVCRCARERKGYPLCGCDRDGYGHGRQCDGACGTEREGCLHQVRQPRALCTGILRCDDRRLCRVQAEPFLLGKRAARHLENDTALR